MYAAARFAKRSQSSRASRASTSEKYALVQLSLDQANVKPEFGRRLARDLTPLLYPQTDPVRGASGSPGLDELQNHLGESKVLETQRPQLGAGWRKVVVNKGCKPSDQLAEAVSLALESKLLGHGVSPHRT